MGRDAELRARVQRLLTGEIRAEDITRLFLWLRERSFGVASVKEIGDFVAHADKRVKGAVTDDLRRFFVYLRSRLPYHRKGFDPADLPPDLPKSAIDNLFCLKGEKVKRRTGLNRKAAEAVLRILFRDFSQDFEGRWGFTRPLEDEEKELLVYLISVIAARPVFTDEDLYRDFAYLLEKHHLLQPEERSALKTVQPGLALFAVAAMHQTEIMLESGWSAGLYAQPYPEDAMERPLIGVWATAPFPLPNGTDSSFSVVAFATSLSVVAGPHRVVRGEC